MKRLIALYFNALRVMIALLLVGMVILVFGNVVLRYAANSGIPVSEELSRWFFVWLVFLGSIVALRDHQHLGIDTLVRKLPMLGRKGCFALSHSLMIFVSAMFLVGSWDQFLINLHTRATVSGLSMGHLLRHRPGVRGFRHRHPWLGAGDGPVGPRRHQRPDGRRRSRGSLT